MAKITLPGGVSFDPEEGVFTGGNIPTSSGGGGRRTPPPRDTSSRSRRYRESGWSRFNEFIEDIGFAISDNAESWANYAAFGLYFLGWLGIAIAIISTWIDEGFFLALLGGVIGGAIYHHVSMFIVGIMMVVFKLILNAIGFIFYSGITFIIALIISVMLFAPSLLGMAKVFLASEEKVPVSTPAPEPVPVVGIKYICTAQSGLKVRSTAYSAGSIIGQLKYKDIVEVYSTTTSGFAEIKYNGKKGFVSLKFLKKLENDKVSYIPLLFDN